MPSDDLVEDPLGGAVKDAAQQARRVLGVAARRAVMHRMAPERVPVLEPEAELEL